MALNKNHLGENGENFNVILLPFYDVVLFPTTYLELVLKDETYIQLVKDSIEKKIPIAICKIESVKNKNENDSIIKTRKIAGFGMPEIIEEREDSIKISIKGQGRVRLNSIVQDMPYIIFNASLYSDQPYSSFILAQTYCKKLDHLLKKWAVKNIKEQEKLTKFLEHSFGPYELVYLVANYLLKDVETKQLLLENNSFTERLILLSNLFLNKQLTADKQAEKIIQNFESDANHGQIESNQSLVFI